MNMTIDNQPLGELLKNHKLLRRTRIGSNSSTYLAESENGRRFAITFTSNEKIFERMRFRAYAEGRSEDEAEQYAQAQLDKFLNDTRSLVERIKGLGSEHVAVTYGIGTEPEKGTLAITSEYTPGVDFFYATRGLKPIQMIQLFVQVLEGLGFIHKSGFLHLNVKPSRLRVDIEGIPPIARFMDFGFGIPVKNWQGEYNGTALYMAPEVIFSQKDLIDERADLYSLGAMMYYCLTGKSPFEERVNALGDKTKLGVILGCEQTPSPPSFYDQTVPAELDNIVLALLSHDPSRRGTRNTASLLNTFFSIWPNESREMPHEETTTLMNP